MKKLIIALTIIIVICIIFLGVKYIFENGTPWERNKAKKEITSYINTKFKNQVIIDELYFDFDYGGISAKLKTLNTPVIKFRAFHYKGELIDNYFIVKWENEIKESVINNTFDHPFEMIKSV